jgi:hypothetical protein
MDTETIAFTEQVLIFQHYLLLKDKVKTSSMAKSQVPPHCHLASFGHPFSLFHYIPEFAAASLQLHLSVECYFRKLTSLRKSVFKFCMC